MLYNKLHTYHAIFLLWLIIFLPQAGTAQDCDKVNSGMQKILQHTVEFSMQAQFERYEAAKETALKIMQIGAEIGNWDAFLIFNARVATNHLILLELDSALHYAQNGMDIAEKHSSRAGSFAKALSRFTYGTTLSELGKYRESANVLSDIPVLLEDTLVVNTDYNGTCDDVGFINTMMRKGLEGQLDQVLGLTYNQTGMAYYRLQETGRAIQYLNLAVERLARANLPAELAKAYFNLGGAYQTILLSDLDAASPRRSSPDVPGEDIQAFMKVLELLENSQEKIAILQSMAYHAMSMSYAVKHQDYEKSLEFMDKAILAIAEVDTLQSLKIASAMPQQFETLFYAEKAYILGKSGRINESKALIQKAQSFIQRDRENKHKNREALTLGSYIMLLTAAELTKNWDVLEVLLEEASGYLFPNIPVEALKKEHIDELTPDYYILAAQLMWYRGRLLERSAAASPEGSALLMQALYYYNLAVQAQSNKLNSFTPPGIRTLSKSSELQGLSTAGSRYYLDGINLAHKLYEQTGDLQYAEEVHQITERLKGYISRQNSKEIQRFREVPPEVQQREQALYDQILSLQKQVEHAKTTQQQRKAEEGLTRAYHELTQYIDGLKPQYPEYYAIKYGDEITTRKEVSTTLLDERTAMIQYVTLSDSTALAFLITPDYTNYRQVLLKTNGTFREAIDALNSAARDRFFSDLNRKDVVANVFVAHASTLYELLIAPFAAYIQPYNRLIIIPSGDLHRLDFNLLLSERVENLPSENGLLYTPDLPFLLKKYAISYAPSATYLMELRAQKAGRASQPDKGELRYIGFEPGYAFCDEMETIPPAVANIRRKYFPTQAEIRLQENASTSVFREIVRKNATKILHFYGHSVVDEKQVLDSYLHFGCGDRPGAQDQLSLRELYTMSIDADLTVLVSCESGISSALQPGEGLLSIARGFAFAGCPALLMSQWKVDADVGRNLNDRFFHYLIEEGKPSDVALQQAKLEYLHATDADVAMLAPRYWAALIAWGHMQPLSFD